MTTPGMGLTLSTPNVTQGIGIAPPGQSWGEQQNSNLSIIDTHTHAPGSGSPVPTSGIAINADLTFNGFNAIGLRSTRFSGLSLGSIGPNDRSCLVASSGDLYFVDGAGNQVRITSAGGVAGTPGAIGGLVSPAAATYTPASKLFSFTSSTPRVAGIACGPLVIGDASVDNGNQVTISAPAGLAGNYALSLPTALPGANALLSLATTGAISAFGTVAGTALSLAGNLTVAGTLALSAANPALIQAIGSNAQLNIQGNRNAADVNDDIAIVSTATRTAGFLLGIWNGAGAPVKKLQVDFQGLLSLASQPGPIQPTSIWTALTPNTNVTAFAGLAYWKDATGVVRIKGAVQNVTGGPVFSLITTTPLRAGFRPTSNRSFRVYSDDGNNLNVQVSTAGGIAISGGTGLANNLNLWLDSVSFLAEA